MRNRTINNNNELEHELAWALDLFYEHLEHFFYKPLNGKDKYELIKQVFREYGKYPAIVSYLKTGGHINWLLEQVLQKDDSEKMQIIYFLLRYADAETIKLLANYKFAYEVANVMIYKEAILWYLSNGIYESGSKNSSIKTSYKRKLEILENSQLTKDDINTYKLKICINDPSTDVCDVCLQAESVSEMKDIVLAIDKAALDNLIVQAYEKRKNISQQQSSRLETFILLMQERIIDEFPKPSANTVQQLSVFNAAEKARKRRIKQSMAEDEDTAQHKISRRKSYG